MALHRISSKSTKDGKVISGPNRMDAAWIQLLVVVLAVILITSSLSELELLVMFGAGLLALVLVFIIHLLLRFKIEVQPGLVSFEKRFAFIPYTRIDFPFSQVKLIHNAILEFESEGQAVIFENHEGFEVDTFLVSTQDKNYEVGNKRDAEIIFRELLEGVKLLNLLDAQPA